MTQTPNPFAILTNGAITFFFGFLLAFLLQRIGQRRVRQQIVALLVRYQSIAHRIISSNDLTQVPALEKDEIVNMVTTSKDGIGIRNESDLGRFQQHAYEIRDNIAGLQALDQSNITSGKYAAIAQLLSTNASAARALLGDRRPLLDSRSLQQAVNSMSHARMYGSMLLDGLSSGIVVFFIVSVILLTLVHRMTTPVVLSSLVVAVAIGITAIRMRKWQAQTLLERLRQKKASVKALLLREVGVILLMIPQGFLFWTVFNK